MSDARVGAARLREFITQALTRLELPPADAATVAALMAEAELQGSDGHGVIRLLPYARRIRAGRINLRPPQIKVTSEAANSANVGTSLADASHWRHDRWPFGRPLARMRSPQQETNYMARKLFQLWLPVLALPALMMGPVALAQSAWPTKPVKIVVTFPPGGAPDTLARVLADKWSQALGQTVTVDNKPGAGGNLGADFVAKSAADGSTLVVGTVGTHAINASLYAKMPYNNIKDFTPITFLASTPNLLVVNNTVPAKNVKELIELAKKEPLTFGSSGSGTSIHLSGELFNTLAGVKMQHIPYKGRAQAVPDLLGGRITMIFDNMPSALPLVKAGEVRALAVTSATRSPAAPNIPTLAESGLPQFEATSWFALLAPAGLPREVQMKINAETLKVLALPDVKEKLATLGLDAAPGTPEALAGVIQAETVKWARVVKESGARAD